MKLKFLMALIPAIIVGLVTATAVSAQGEPPPPYAGLENPFPWEDSSAQAAGMDVYRQSCLGCHGISGSNISGFDFSKKEFSQNMETSPDFFFWVLSEGRLAQGMPSYGSSLSEEQRWQVLTYLHSLGVAEVTPGPETPVETVEGTVKLAAPRQAEYGQPITLSATLVDDEGKAIANAPVKFYVSAELFMRGFAEIGKAVTDGQGKAVLEYTPRQSGELEMAARYGTNEAKAAVSVAEGGEHSYEAEAGLHFPRPGGDILIGPKGATDLGPDSSAPLSAFRLPGGIFSWLLPVVITVAFIWFTYFRVMYQVFRIPVAGETSGINTRLIPTFGLIMIVFIGTLLVTMLLTGPYSHLHLPR